jgi:hypothetical protein
MTEIVNKPIGYRIEYRPGRYCFYDLSGFLLETQRDGGRIHSLHKTPVPGCPAEPVVYRGSYWTATENRHANSRMDPFAEPCYLGPELHDPEDAR